MKKIVFISLIAYLTTLAATQTVYGRGFMNLRWVSLVILLVAGSLYWIALRSRGRSSISLDKSAGLLLAYLLMTFVTVISAENPLFSGFRWASHTVMLITFVIFIRQNMTSNHTQIILWALKFLVAGLLFLSLLKPAPRTIFDDLPVFRGAMSNGNTMGQIAAMNVLLWFHGFLVERKNWARYAAVGFACVGVVTLWWTGSRSAMIMLIAGFFLITYFYRREMKRKVILCIVLISLSAFISPELPRKAINFITKSQDASTVTSKQITKTRARVWLSAWEGFQDRPIFGWGFGADSGMGKNWSVSLTALGTVERDAVNDFLFMLEGCGVIGFAAYFLLIYIAFLQVPTRIGMLSLKNGNSYIPLYNMHAIFFTLSISMLMLVQFDNTALSAGNFISVVLWLSVSAAGTLRREAKASEMAMRNYITAESIRTAGNTFASSSPSR